MLRNILFLAALLMISFPSVESFAGAGDDKGTIGVYCVDFQGKSHQAVSEAKGTDAGDHAQNAAFKACIDEVVHSWEQTHSSFKVRASDSTKIKAVDLNTLLNGYDSYREAMEGAASRLK